MYLLLNQNVQSPTGVNIPRGVDLIAVRSYWGVNIPRGLDLLSFPKCTANLYCIS